MLEQPISGGFVTKRAIILSLIAVAAAIALIIHTAVNKDDGMNEPAQSQKLGKPEPPFAVSLRVKEGSGDFRTLTAVFRSDIKLDNAELTIIPFDGLEVISPSAPKKFVALAGETIEFDIRVRINSNGFCACTAEVIARFDGGTTLVANDAVKFAAGQPVRGDLKPILPSVDHIRIQDVPATNN